MSEETKTMKFRVYGADGHRQRRSFYTSAQFVTWSKIFVSILASDITGSNQYVDVIITAKDEKDCYKNLFAQEADGVFENSKTGKITVFEEGKELALKYNAFGEYVRGIETQKDLDALLYVLKYLGFDTDDETLQNNLEHGFLTINEGRNGKKYAWYFDESKEFCVDVETLKPLTPEEIEKYLS